MQWLMKRLGLKKVQPQMPAVTAEWKIVAIRQVTAQSMPQPQARTLASLNTRSKHLLNPINTNQTITHTTRCTSTVANIFLPRRTCLPCMIFYFLELMLCASRGSTAPQARCCFLSIGPSQIVKIGGCNRLLQLNELQHAKNTPGRR